MSMGFGFALPALRQSGFSPLSLFADGSQGVWYDDSLTSSMFQDSAGTTAAALESPVGLQLDLSQGLALGTQLVANNNFDTDTVWVKGANWSITGGAAVGAGASSYIDQLQGLPATIAAGQVYKVVYVISQYTSGSVKPYINSSPVFGQTASAVGTYTSYITSAAATREVGFLGASFVGQIDLITVQLVAGNHRTQTTSANRPTLSARYNLLTKTEQFDNAAWSKGNLTITANATTDPLGGNTADKLAENTILPVEHYLLQTQTVVAAQHTVSVYLKAAERTWASIYFSTGSINSTWFNLAADGSGGVGTVGTGCTATSTYVGNGWYQCSVTITTTAAAWSLVINPALGNGSSVIYVGTVGYGIYAWGADLRPTNQTVTLPTYQRVDTSSVYDTVGFPQYLKYNGSNSSLSTASINFTATAQMSAFSGVRKFNTAVGIFYEFSVNAPANNGTFAVAVDTPIAATYDITAKQSVQYEARTSPNFSSPITNTLTHIIDFSVVTASAASTLRVNSTLQSMTQVSGGNMGSGNFGTYPLYFGARAGTSLFFNGQEYQTIIIGKTLTATEISNTETYVNSKTKAY